MFWLSQRLDFEVTGGSSSGARTSKSRTVRSAGAFPFTWTSPTKSFFLPKAHEGVNTCGSSPFISNGKPNFFSPRLLNWVVPFEQKNYHLRLGVTPNQMINGLFI